MRIPPDPPLEGLTRHQVIERRTAARAKNLALQAKLPGAGSSVRKRIGRERKPVLDELHAIGEWLRAHRSGDA